MHEMAIVNNLLNECEKIRKENKAKKIVKIKVSIGRLAGVEAHYLKEAFFAFTADKNSSYYNCDLEVVDKELILYCNDCKKDFTQEKNEFRCKICNSLNIEIISGEELLLEKVELE